MIQTLRNFFHTDKLLGKILFILFLYIAYLLVWYVVAPFLIFSIQDWSFGGTFFFVIIFLVAPVCSYMIPKIIMKSFNINKTLVYFSHTILVVAIPFLFLFLLFKTATFNFGGF